MKERKIVVGLGNPSQKYADTRHNIGFSMLDHIVSSAGYEFKLAKKHNAEIAELSIGDTTVTFVKPQTYYNESGVSVRSILDFYKLESSDVVVVHDELALPFGTIRSRIGGSDAGNNGIKSVSTHIGERYGRIRVGVWNEKRDVMDDADFVLSKFTSTETALMDQVKKEVKENVIAFATDDDFGANTRRIQRQTEDI